MRSTFVFFHFALAWTAIGASAEEMHVYDGKWMATWTADGGKHVQAQLILKDTSGSWKVFASSRESKNNGCVGRAVAVLVQSSTQEEITFTIDPAKDLPGCKVRSVTAKPVNANTLEGIFKGGRAIRFVRE